MSAASENFTQTHSQVAKKITQNIQSSSESGMPNLTAKHNKTSRIVDSQNSIFDPANKLKTNSAASGTDERSSKILSKFKFQSREVSITLPKEQPIREVEEPVVPPEPKPKTLREILDGLDDQIPDLQFLNQNPFLTSGQNSNDEVRLYEQYCVRGGIAADHLRMTQDYEDQKQLPEYIESRPSVH